MSRQSVVCVTTFRQGDPGNDIEKVRSEVFMDTAKNLNSCDIPLVAIFTETRNDCLELLGKQGVVLQEQQTEGMGNVRREALAAARAAFPEAEYYCWLEPEKSGLVRFLEPAAEQMRRVKSVLGLFNRISMESYPVEQAHYYLFCRAVASQLLGFDLDYAFGPMIIGRRVIRYFLEYRGEHGDKWDSILVPRLRILKHGLSVSRIPIEFKNDPRMTAIESGNPTLILKRLEQLGNVVPSLIQEWNTSMK